MIDNHIKVPESLQHLMRKERNNDWEYAEACIRDYVKEHSGIIITLPMLATASGLSSPNKRITQLISEGKLTRWSVRTGKPGRYYKYRWNDVPLIQKPDYTKPSAIITRSLDLPKTKLTADAVAWVGTEILDKGHTYSADQVMGLLKLRQKMSEELEQVEADRKRIIEENKS